MGVYAGPEISNDGLVLALDAGNSKGFDDDENLRTNSDTGGFYPVVGTWTSTATSTDIIAPNGSSTTYKVVSAGGGQSSIDIAYGQIGLTAGVTYTVSAHFYATGSTTGSRTIGIAVFGNGMSGTGSIVLPQNQWVRQSFTFTATTTTGFGQVRIIDNDTSGFNTTNGAVIYLWGAQLETGSSASPYYPTTGTAKNRGTTLIDMTGRGNNGTLTNSPTYNSSNSGSIVFDGVDDYIDFFAPNLGTTTTVEMWVKLGAGYSGKMFFGWLVYDVWCGASHLGYNTANGDVYGISSSNVSSLGLVDNWKHYVFEMRSDVSYTNNKIYINGVSQTLSQQSGSEASGNRNFNSGNGRISGWRLDVNYPIPMNCSSFKVYNRVLTAAEIQQNFNALRGRFGI